MGSLQWLSDELMVYSVLLVYMGWVFIYSSDIAYSPRL